MIQKALKNQASRLNFALGRNPKITGKGESQNFIPDGYKAVVTFTADFELAWAPRYNNSVNDPLEFALKLARRERQNVPVLLQYCDQYKVPVTWATVGHLFLESCFSNGSSPHPEIPDVPPYRGPYWNFRGGNWFEHDPCASYGEAPEWYAPDLIEQILKAEVPHEIGCHTFSHIDCRDDVCPAGLFESELELCKKLAKDKDLELRSFVHPGHTIGHLDLLAKLGFSSFQSDPGNILGFPIRHTNGLWELQRTYELHYRPEWSDSYQVYRLKTIIDRAIQHRKVCNFWFHPSFSTLLLREVLPAFFAHLQSCRDMVFVSTVRDYVDFLNQKSFRQTIQ